MQKMIRVNIYIGEKSVKYTGLLRIEKMKISTYEVILLHDELSKKVLM